MPPADGGNTAAYSRRCVFTHCSSKAYPNFLLPGSPDITPEQAEDVPQTEEESASQGDDLPDFTSDNNDAGIQPEAAYIQQIRMQSGKVLYILQGSLWDYDRLLLAEETQDFDTNENFYILRMCWILLMRR